MLKGFNTKFNPDFIPTPDQLDYSYYMRHCWFKGCPNRGQYQPVLGLSPNGINYIYRNFGNLLLCEHHKSIIGLTDIIDHKGFIRVQLAFKLSLKPVPEWEHTILHWRLG